MISKNQNIIKSISSNFNEYLQQEESYAYIHGCVYYYYIKQDKNSLKIPEIFYEQAKNFYDEWFSQEKSIKYRNNIIYSPFDETLLDYLHLLAQKIDPNMRLKKENSSLKQRLNNYSYPHENFIISLRSFCHYLRNKYLLNIEGFLNIIFTEKMDVKNSTLVRRILI